MLAGAMLLAACTGATVEQDAAAPAHVTIAVVPYLTLAPVYIARAEGFFEQEGLDVEFVRLARNQELMTALATGDIDVSAGMLTVNEMALALAGARVRMIAAMGEFAPDGCTLGAVLARRELAESGALEDPTRIREMVLDTSMLLPFGHWVDQVLRPMGLTSDDLETVDLPSTAAFPALLDGAIDLTIDTEPYLSRLLATGEVAVWRPIEEIAPGYVLTMLMFGPDLLDERPDVGRRVTVAILRAIRQLRLGKTPRNLEILREQMGLASEELERICLPPLRADGRIDPAPFRGYQRWAVDHGLIDRVPTDDELFDDRFIEHANAELDR
jgi:NitT/TauT family transport system substrate-binding protein